MAVTVCHQFSGTLGGGVERRRTVDPVIDRKWNDFVGTVDRRGTGVDKMLQLRHRACEFEDVELSFDIRCRVGMGCHEGVSDTGLCGEVNDAVNAGFAGGETGHRLPVGKVHADERKGAIVLKPGEARLLECDVIVVAETVEPDHIIVPLQQGAGHMVADESRSAGHEYLHDRP